MIQWVKGPTLSLQQATVNPWPGNFHMPQAQPKMKIFLKKETFLNNNFICYFQWQIVTPYNLHSRSSFQVIQNQLPQNRHKVIHSSCPQFIFTLQLSHCRKTVSFLASLFLLLYFTFLS